jgi:hypothetical protein
MIFALIKNNRVDNIIIAEQEFADSLSGSYQAVVQSDTAQIGWEWDGSAIVVPPPPPEPEPVIEPEPPRLITRLAFRNRFTTAEKVALEIAGLDDPAAPMAARAQAAALRANAADLAAATFVDLDRPDTRAGVLMLEAGGLLAVDRALEILDSPITAAERPR